MSSHDRLRVNTLLLVPTEIEVRRFVDDGRFGSKLVQTAISGLGPVMAAARTAALVAQFSPQRVLLAGIAGTFDDTALPVGDAARFERVRLVGVGVGFEPTHLAPSEAGMPQWPGGNESATGGILEEISLYRPLNVPRANLLLTCCAASANADERDSRRSRFPDAVAEDMEGFGVAAACALAGVPLAVVRGMSNRVGDRDKKNWRIDEALEAALELVTRIIESDDAWEAPD